MQEKEINYIFKSEAQIEALHWYDPQQVILAFHNGALANWDLGAVDVFTKPSLDIMYGPMPCKPITSVNKINDLKVFQGGLPRASYGDKYSVTAMSLQDHLVFDFSSKGSGCRLFDGIIKLPSEIHFNHYQ